MSDAASAIEYFKSVGWTPDQAAGLAANGQRESGFNPAAVGDNGKAYGIFQWHPDRQAIFQQVMGKPIQGSSVQEQLAFANYELTRGNEQVAGNALRSADNAAHAAIIASKQWLRPGDVQGEASARAQIAMGLTGHGGTTAPHPASIDALFPGAAGVRAQEAVSLFGGDQNQALSNSVNNTQPADKASRIYKMELETGLPVDVISRNLDQIEKITQQANFDAESFRQKSPLLAQWLVKNPLNASVSKNDYDNLSALEKLWNSAQAIPQGFEQGIKEQQLMMLNYKAVDGSLTPQEDIQRKQLRQEIQAMDQQNAYGWPSWFKSAADMVGMQLPMVGEALKKSAEFGIPLGAAGGAALGAIGGPGAPVTVPAGAAIGGMIGARTAFTGSYIDQTYKMGVGQAYDQLENATDVHGNHINPTAARYAAMLVAAPNTLLQFAGVQQALKVIPGADKVIGQLSADGMKQILLRPSVMAALKDFTAKYAGAMGTQAFMTGAQQFTTILARELATGDVGRGLTGQDAASVGSAAFGGFKSMAILGALASGPKVMELYHDMSKADRTADFMHDLGSIVSESKTYKNAPEAMKDYISFLKKDGPIQNVYVPIERWDALFQDKAPDAAKEVFGDLKAYSEAKTTGGDLAIPIETYAEKLAGTQFHEPLVPDIRLNPGDMTQRETEAMSSAEPQIVKGLQKELADTLSKEMPLQQVYQDVYGKLIQSGMGHAEADRDAILEREMIRSRADRLGIDPLQLYQENPLQVSRELPKGVAEQLKAYNQGLVEPAVPHTERLPLPEGETGLKATPEESSTAKAALAAAEHSQEQFGVYGATVHPAQGDQMGKEGVAVAGYPQRGVVTEGVPTQKDVETFLAKNRDIFKADPHAALGLWVDHESGKGYIDIANVLHRDAAIAQGEYLGEKAVFDLQKGEEIRLPVNPAEAAQRMLFQGGARGAAIPSKNLVVLLRGADPTTFVHELGHLSLENLRADAMRPDAPEQLKLDWQTIKEHFGASDEKIPTEAHESFARSFEAYMMEGKAPSFQLREVFAKIKDWMLNIYKNMTALNVELKPEVRDVFDRLLATDDAIKAERERQQYDKPLLDKSMMTDEEYKAYSNLNAEAKAHAEDAFRVQVMKELRREKLDAWRKERDAMQTSVRNDILQNPIYKVANWLHTGNLPDGTKVEGLEGKLDKQALLDLGVNLQDLPFKYQNNGLLPDVVAEHFGFPSGESMVRELIGLPTLKSAIDAEVSNRMKSEHGDLMTDPRFMDKAALEVQNTRQADVFNMELRILKRMGATREITHPAIMKDIARQMIDRQLVGQLNPKAFEAAGIKAGQEADAALLGKEFRIGTGRNLDAAFDAKQKQMLNSFLYREAMERQNDIEKSVKKWTKFLFRSDERLSKDRNMDMVNAARSIAASHDIGRSADTAAKFMEQMRIYDEQTYQDMHGIVDAVTSNTKPLKDLTMAEFSMMKDAIEGLWGTSRRVNQAMIDERLVDRKQIVGDLTARISDLIPAGKMRAGYEHAVTGMDKFKAGLSGAFSMLRRVESWVDAMDNGDPNGAFRTYIWNPISEAAEKYRDARGALLKDYLKYIDSLPKDLFPKGKIDAPEIGYTFKDMTELLGAVMHTGNESNQRKLLVGRQWGALVDGELDTSKWDAFIKRMEDTGTLRKEHYDLVQHAWDMFEGLKPEAQEVHHKMYGYYFNEITRRPFQTKYGMYEGGYVPATADPFMVEDAAIRQEKQALEEKPSSWMFPTTGRGFTLDRSENYNVPLSIDFNSIPNALEKELRFIHLEQHIKDVGRVVIDKNFRSTLAGLDQQVGSMMLVPWLQRTALQQVEQPSGPKMRQFDQFIHAIRRNTGMQIISFNTTVAMHHMTGISKSAVLVEPHYLAGAMARFASSPSDYAANINDASVFMKNRVTSSIMDTRQAIDQILLNKSGIQKVSDFAERHSHFMTQGVQNVVDQITWGGAYDQAIDKGYDEKSALRQADSAVRESQGSFNPEDISRIEAGRAWSRLFTMFYNHFNALANMNATEFIKAQREGGFAGAGRALYVYTMGFLIPGVVSAGIVEAMGGTLFDPNDQEGAMTKIASLLFGGQMRFAAAMVPGAGPMAMSAINKFTRRDDQINLSPAVNTINQSLSVPSDIYKVATGDNIREKQPIQDVLTLIGMTTGLPTGPLGKPLGYLSDLNQNEIRQPSNALDFTRGLASGRGPK